MPDLPQTINLPTITKDWNNELLRNWTLMIQTLNALSRVDLAANKPATPDLDHIFFTESDGSQLTYVAVNGAWQVVGGVSGLSDGDKGDVTVSVGGTVWTIDNDVVTYAKMQNISAASRLLGRGSAAGAGDPEEITLGTNLSMSGTTLNVASAAPSLARAFAIMGA